MKWTEDETVQFVELYRDHECLWNMTKASYRNKHMRLMVIENIIQGMQRAQFGIAEDKQKIKNIRSTYKQEVQKINKSLKSGTSPEDVYTPSVKWFDTMHQIMRGGKEPGETISNLDPLVADSQNEQEEELEEDVTPLGNHSANDQEVSQEPFSQTPSSQQASSQQLLSEQKRCQSSKGATRSSSSSNLRTPKGTKRRLHDLSQAVSELRTMNQFMSQSAPAVRENEAFGKYVSSALDKLPQREAILAQSEIQSVLTRYRLNVAATPSPCMSHTQINYQGYQPQGFTSPTIISHPSPSPSPSTSTSYSNEEATQAEMGTADILSEAWSVTNNE